jgi:hypothetical protein
METKTASNRMYALVVLYDMQTKFFSSAIDGISDDQAHNRLNTRANHVAWLTGSLVHQRFDVASQLGIAGKQSADELFKEFKGIADEVRYPSLESFRNDWEAISPKLREALINVTDARLNEPFNMPGATMSFYELLSFMIYREANCIGQIALWRRLLGYEAMKYM